MSLRTKIVASIAVAASAFLIAPAVAQAATHPVQVSGAKLKSALLPASAFGSGFKVVGATSSGKSLMHQKATKHVPTMSCTNFENQGLTSYGESAVATSVTINNSAATTSLSNLNILYDQTVYQFPSTKAAAAFYSQAKAKYASCKSFTAFVSGGPDSDKTTITLKSLAKTKVGTYKAFQVVQSLGDSAMPDVPVNLETLVTVEGADVFVIVDFTTSNHQVPAKTMLKLVNRVKAAR
jgi:PknH-like extracellular domain